MADEKGVDCEQWEREIDEGGMIRATVPANRTEFSLEMTCGGSPG